MDNLKITEQQTGLVDQVEETLRNYFRTQNLKPGDSILPEKELADAIGVGRSVVREALSRLRMLGLISSRSGRGMVITEPCIFESLKRITGPGILGDDAMFELLGFRITLEIGMTELIFQNINERHLADLDAIIERGREIEFSEYSTASEYEFHSKLYEITGNSTIIEFQKIIHPVLVFLNDRFRENFLPINKAIARRKKLVTHKDLVDFLKAGDREGFHRGMIDQFESYFIFLKDKSIVTNSKLTALNTNTM
ncbi:MAG: GntR family transcriptional regulator [Bacteroidales bacterium]|nr:GntR family transcriptional regulator [Bacteroidales bacterium]